MGVGEALVPHIWFLTYISHFSVRLRVYGPAESQQVVFADVCPLLTSLLDG